MSDVKLRQRARGAKLDPAEVQAAQRERERHGLMTLWKLEVVAAVPVKLATPLVLERFGWFRRSCHGLRQRLEGRDHGTLLRVVVCPACGADDEGHSCGRYMVESHPPLSMRWVLDQERIVRESVTAFCRMYAVLFSTLFRPAYTLESLEQPTGVIGGGELVYVASDGYAYWLDGDASEWVPIFRVLRPESLIVRAVSAEEARQSVTSSLLWTDPKRVRVTELTADGEPGLIV